MAADAVYQGTEEDVHEYTSIGISIHSTNASDGVLTIQVSHDKIYWREVTRTITNANMKHPNTWLRVERHFKIKYTNGTTEADNLSIQVNLSNDGNIQLGHQLDEVLLDETQTSIVRSVIVAQDAGGTYRNIGIDSLGDLKIAFPLTAFGDLRIAELSAIFQVPFEYTVSNTKLNTNTTTNGGTITQADAMAVVRTSTTTASWARLHIKPRARYRAGFGGLTRFTALFTTPVASTIQYIGLADRHGSSEEFENGLTIGYTGTTFGFQQWRNENLIEVAQSAWDDPLDGTGASGMTLDQTKLNVWAIAYQYLGGGSLLLFIVDDTSFYVPVHTIKYANLNTVPSSYNPNYTFMIHVDNLGTTSDLIIKSASTAYFIEGKTKHTELQQAIFSSDIQEKTSITTEIAIFTIRNKSTYASKTNYIDVILEIITASVEASAPNNLATIRVVRNATLGGTPSYSDINTADSVIEIDTAGTTVTGGELLFPISLAGKNDKTFHDVKGHGFIVSPGETITVASLSAGSATINASLTWKELF